MTSAIITDNAEICWLPLPRFDSSAPFCTILDDQKAGYFRIELDSQREYKQSYIAPNVLKTSIKTDNGECSIIDFLLLGEPRLIRELKSTVKIKLFIRPKFEYGKYEPKIEKRESGALFINPNGGDAIELEIKDATILGYNGDTEWTLSPGIGRIILTYYPDYPRESDAKQNAAVDSLLLDRTTSYWNSILSKETAEEQVNLPTELPVEFKDLFVSSLSTVLGLMYGPSGGIIASPTTSLPESVGGFRNWDYRYVWVRDATMMAKALMSAGFKLQAGRTITFLLNLISHSDKPFASIYTVGGLKPPPERQLFWLSGVANSKPVRVGNSAALQTQLDIEGYFMDLFESYCRDAENLTFLKTNWSTINCIVAWISENWQLSDSGIWEEPFPQEFTYSKAMMWVALDRAIKLGKKLDIKLDNAEKAKADIRTWIFDNCIKDGAFVKTPYTNETDASLLTLPLYGFIGLDEPIFLNTLNNIEKDLVVDGFVYRYKNYEIGKPSHQFTLCSAWLSSVYAKMGRIDNAQTLIKNVSELCGPLKLVGEHVDKDNKFFLGNFPQGFAHAGIINALIDISNGMDGVG